MENRPQGIIWCNQNYSIVSGVKFMTPLILMDHQKYNRLLANLSSLCFTSLCLQS